MVKRVLSLGLAVIMGLMLSCAAFAIGPEEAIAGVDKTVVSNYSEADDVLSGSTMQTRGTSLPSSEWKLSEESYDADLKVVGKAWLYTNYYFYPNGEGKINVSYNVTADTSTTDLYIGLYDLTKRELVVEHGPVEVRTTGKDYSVGFYNLVPSHKYAVCFRAHPSSLTGSATIYH